jgi:hypothetical protein
MAREAYVKILLDESGELIGVEAGGKTYEAEDVGHDRKNKVPKKVKEGWDLKLVKVWHNSPCCVQMGTKIVCWPPCI